VFNQELRAFGNAAATAVNWSANLIVSSTFLHLSHGASAGPFVPRKTRKTLSLILLFFLFPAPLRSRNSCRRVRNLRDRGRPRLAVHLEIPTGCVRPPGFLVKNLDFSFLSVSSPS
jgi:hypothetical protein